MLPSAQAHELLDRMDTAAAQLSSQTEPTGSEQKGSTRCVVCHSSGTECKAPLLCHSLQSLQGRPRCYHACYGCGLADHGARDCPTKRVPQTLNDRGQRICGKCWAHNYTERHCSDCESGSDNIRALLVALLFNTHLLDSFKQMLRQLNSTYGVIWTATDLVRLQELFRPQDAESLAAAVLWLCCPATGLPVPRTQFVCLWWSSYCSRGEVSEPVSLYAAVVMSMLCGILTCVQTSGMHTSSQGDAVQPEPKQRRIVRLSTGLSLGF